ncbi:MAG: hypothetical protein IMZ69_01840 [Spirochaetes bacterium]|nr:hypothetical protein [Spirochaetota bacterium]
MRGDKPHNGLSLTDCESPDCGCESNGLARRGFLKLSGLAATGLAFSGLPAMAGPFTQEDFDKLVPADKKLRPEWVKSLFERGTKTTYYWPESRLIGMPVGGICAGQLYLGGDGKLWHWDIFNQVVRTSSAHYAKPPQPSSPVDQGFALRMTAAGRSDVRPLDHTGWTDISFNGEYPIGFVEYRDPESPVRVSLEAFSPFIPLNPDDSALPATVMRFTVTNIGAERVDAELAGWLENAVCLNSGPSSAGQRRNQIVHGNGLTFLECSATAALDAPGLPHTGQPDFGTMGLALLDETLEINRASVSLPEAQPSSELFSTPPAVSETPVGKPLTEKLVGSLGCRFSLDPGQSATATFVVTWHFPNITLAGLGGYEGRWYGKKFSGARAVADYVAQNFARLASHTRRWHDTWYDSTLPYWFLDRTFLNTSILATNTCYWFGNGRFYGWEGVGCCAGTCTHVWHYAHAVGRLFPSLERSLREMVDYGAAFDADTGLIRFRAEHAEHTDQWAADGQAGVILRTYREHQMSADDQFLRRVWPKAKTALRFLIAHDEGLDGILDGAQHNTLDAQWWGKVAWLSGLYLAALRAGEEMAREVGDEAFVQQCAGILAKGRPLLVAQLFDGEYFVNRVDPQHLDTINSGTGCEIDQVFGQGWAFQVGLGRVLPEEETRTALRSLWRYNFAPDVGPYRNANKPGRWYAMPGEAGLLMCTFPRANWDFAKARGVGNLKPSYAGYFNECMNGFEYQVAGHMVWEGLLQEGLAVTRAVHDRYHAARRNPWNEVECGNHYARSMASYGVFLAACGYEHHGPMGHLGFTPRLTPEDFRCPFTTAEGWGTFEQKTGGRRHVAGIAVKFGRLRLRTLALGVVGNEEPRTVKVIVAGKPVPATLSVNKGKADIKLGAEVVVKEGEHVEVELT